MSEHADADADFDLTDVPMDEPEVDDDLAGEEGEEGEEKPAEGADATALPPLPPEELTKRLTSTKTALAQERRARRDLEQRLRTLESGERAPARQEQRREEQPEEDIDPEVDPMGALRQMRRKIQAYEQAERMEAQTQEQREQRERQFTQVEQAFAEHEADFREDHADYDEAAKHYAVSRAQELMQFGIAPTKIQPMLREEFATLASTAIKAGKNPAAVVYEMAKGRGYGKKAADPKEPKAADTKLKDLARGSRATSPLSRAGGRAPTGLDAQTIASIDIRSKKGREAFEKAFDAMERQAKAR
jgi:hypothetical protein